jgi:CubicO group peptidase (beta-lactamase class C family)
LVAEQYAEGIRADTPLIGWSMTKSVTNLLIGILVGDDKLNISKPAPVPEWQIEATDPRARITIDHLLHMSSGLEFDEEYGLFSDVTQMLSNEADMAHFAASKPLSSGNPEYKWSYSSGTTNILAGIIRRTVGTDAQSIYDFVQKRLFQPLGIRTATLELDASGTPIGSSYMYASARDWARLGELCLNDGRWLGVQILPEGWMKYSTTPAAENPSNNYGAHFWLNKKPLDPGQSRAFPLLPEDAFAMNGYQGQYVVVVPSHSLVVVRLGFTWLENHGVERLIADIIRVLNIPEHNL